MLGHAAQDLRVLDEGLVVAPRELEHAPQLQEAVHVQGVLGGHALQLRPIGRGVPLHVGRGGHQGPRMKVRGVTLENALELLARILGLLGHQAEPREHPPRRGVLRTDLEHGARRRFRPGELGVFEASRPWPDTRRDAG